MTKYEILIDYIQNNAEELYYHAIHCDTPEKAKDLISLLYLLDFHWENDTNINTHFNNNEVITNWDKKGRRTCYSILPSKIILYGNKSFYESQGKNIISYDELFAEADNLTDVTKIELEKAPDKTENSVPETQNDNTKINNEKEQDVAFCPECGTPLHSGTEKFCMNCGYDLFSNTLLKEEINQEETDDKASVQEGINPVSLIENQDVGDNNNPSDVKETSQVVSINANVATKIQLIFISAIIILFLIVIVGVKIIQFSYPNHFEEFSGIWETVRLDILNILTSL